MAKTQLNIKKIDNSYSLILSNQHLSIADITQVADFISSGEAPIDFFINFRDSQFLDEQKIKILAQAVTSGRAPIGLVIGLSNTKLNLESIKAIAEAISSSLTPSGFKLHLSSNNMCLPGVKAIFNAINSGNAPANFELYLDNNNLGVEGAKVVAETLRGGHTPIKFTLCLSGNNFGDEGAQIIAEALSSEKATSQLNLTFRLNNIGNEGVQSLVKALNSGKMPTGLSLDLKYNNFDANSEIMLQQAWLNYYRQIALRCFVVKQGQRQNNSLFSQLPNEIIDAILKYFEPNAQRYIAKMKQYSTQCFLDHYSPAFFQSDAEHNQILIKQLAEALLCKSDLQRKIAIEKCIQTYLDEELNTCVYRPSIVVTMLARYHLLNPRQLTEDCEMGGFRLNYRAV